MRIKIHIFLIILSLPILFSCSDNGPTEQQIFKTMKNDSIIAKKNFLELRAVSIKSSSWVDDKYRALLQIDFYNKKDTMNWDGAGEKNFIPFGMKIVKGMNSVDATGTFSISYAGDGSWYVESFSIN